jgi:hypothetical protein
MAGPEVSAVESFGSREAQASELAAILTVS